MGQTLNGNVDTSATNGFTPGSCDQTGPGWPANMVGAWATQRAEWIAAMAKRESSSLKERARGFFQLFFDVTAKKAAAS